MITEAQVYWITRLDNVNTAFAVVCGALIIYIVVCAGWVFLIWLEDHNIFTDFLRRIRNASIALLIVTIAWIFVPTTKEMALIKILPAVANSELVQTTIPAEVKDLCQLAKEALREKLGAKPDK